MEMEIRQTIGRWPRRMHARECCSVAFKWHLPRRALRKGGKEHHSVMQRDGIGSRDERTYYSLMNYI